MSASHPKIVDLPDLDPLSVLRVARLRRLEQKSPTICCRLSPWNRPGGYKHSMSIVHIRLTSGPMIVC